MLEVASPTQVHLPVLIDLVILMYCRNIREENLVAHANLFIIFPLKINWSHLSEVGERGIAVRWAYNIFTPRVRYSGVTE